MSVSHESFSRPVPACDSDATRPNGVRGREPRSPTPGERGRSLSLPTTRGLSVPRREMTSAERKSFVHSAVSPPEYLAGRCEVETVQEPA